MFYLELQNTVVIVRTCRAKLLPPSGSGRVLQINIKTILNLTAPAGSQHDRGVVFVWEGHGALRYCSVSEHFPLGLSVAAKFLKHGIACSFL